MRAITTEERRARLAVRHRLAPSAQGDDDPTTMGWQQRAWYLGDHKGPLFDTNGNAGPTVWADGRIVGGWAQRRSGEVAVRLLEDLGDEQQSHVAIAAADLERVLGEVRVVPRFPTPLARELAA